MYHGRMRFIQLINVSGLLRQSFRCKVLHSEKSTGLRSGLFVRHTFFRFSKLRHYGSAGIGCVTETVNNNFIGSILFHCICAKILF